MENRDSDSDEESKLGKHEHWEQAYTTELANWHDTGDEGEVWFGEDVLATMLDWTDSLLQQRLSDANSAEILDLGTGNGSFLFGLADRGYHNLSGSDYSANAIQLAQAIARKRKAQNISWHRDDMLDTQLTKRYDVLTDKGTLDAVGLSARPAENRARYRHAAWKLLKPGGHLIVTSCNSTTQELEEEFCTAEEEAKFTFVDKVKTYPVFRFGGIEGSKVCTLAFQKTL